MDASQVGQAAAGFGILLGGLFGGYQSWQGRKEAKHAGREASRAAEHAYPISNGWGTQLRDDVAEVRRLVGQVHEGQVLQDRRLERIDTTLQDHLRDHQESVA